MFQLKRGLLIKEDERLVRSIIEVNSSDELETKANLQWLYITPIPHR